MQNPTGTQWKGILMPGIDRRIVNDEECPIVAELGKKEKQCKKTADGGLLVTSLSFHNLSITYMTTTNNVSNTIMIAFPNPFQW